MKSSGAKLFVIQEGSSDNHRVVSQDPKKRAKGHTDRVDYLLSRLNELCTNDAQFKQFNVYEGENHSHNSELIVWDSEKLELVKNPKD